MGKKILIAYTTNAGSTFEVAEAIAKTLSQSGVQLVCAKSKRWLM